MRRVLILAPGSQGDVLPYVALGLGLLRAGYQVRLGAAEGFRDLATRWGLEFRPIPDESASKQDAHLRDEADRPTRPLRWVIENARFSPVTTIWRLFRLRKQSDLGLRLTLESSWAACQDVDGIIASYLAIAGWHVAEKLSVPFIWAVVYPVGQTTEFPYFMAPYGIKLGPLYNRLSHAAAEQIFWEIQRPAVDDWRRQHGLRPMRLSSVYDYRRIRNVPVAYGYSGALVPKPHDWGPHMEVVGHWALEREPSWSPPATLTGFLKESDDPPVSIGFGSVTDLPTAYLVDLASNALAESGRRGVIISGDFGQSDRRLSNHLYLLASAPHNWLFPRMSAVVHHGGVGTTAEGLRWGRPTVTVPQFSDQYFWGNRVAKLGAATPPIPRRSLTANNLAAAIRIATTSREMLDSAAALSRSMAAENGVQRFVDLFRTLCPV